MKKPKRHKNVIPPHGSCMFVNVGKYAMVNSDITVVVTAQEKDNRETMYSFFERAFRYAAEHDCCILSHASTQEFPEEIEGWKKFSFEQFVHNGLQEKNVLYIDPITDAWVEVFRDQKHKEDVWKIRSLLGHSEKDVSHADAIPRVRLLISESRIRRYLTQISPS